ncbi:MAG: response regulator, partial [Syntrophorhabdaceae bacterium]|nr:response regulator [Syntrophorhabdaceae bacterium]
MQKKLLLVEDSATIQKVFEFAFEKTDISVIAVSNGEDAIQMAKQISPDLVVVDVTLQGRDGFEIAALLNAEEFMKGIPVLILAGAFASLDEKKFRACGAKGILHKPFDVSELMERVDNLFKKDKEGRPPVKEDAPPPRADLVDFPQQTDNRWDFSDVLDEVEGKAPATKPEAAAAAMPEAPSAKPETGDDLGEFDVSADDMEKPAAASFADSSSELFTMEEAVLASAGAEKIEEVEEFEEIGEIEDGTTPVFIESAKAEEVFVETSAPFISDISFDTDTDVLEDILEKTPAKTEAKQPFAEIRTEKLLSVQEEAPVKTEAEKPLPEAAAGMSLSVREEKIPANVGAPPDISEGMLQAELKKQFASRAEDIFREVMERAVEKAMLEMTERLTAEFTEKMRESVEVIAWEVIPVTAETLIREEIARIRTQAVKSS